MKMAKFLKDFPKGPLDRYRKVASFDWKKLKVFLDTEEIIEFEVNKIITYKLFFWISHLMMC